MEKRRARGTDAGNAAKRLRRGAQNAVERAEFFHQRVRGRIRVRARDRVEQKQLENVVILKRIETVPLKARKEPLSVTGMDVFLWLLRHQSALSSMSICAARASEAPGAV